MGVEMIVKPRWQPSVEVDNVWVTSDEHYHHANSIRYDRRPFSSVDEMNREMVRRHNEVVGDDDLVIHAGDFSMAGRQQAQNIISRLKGTHWFLEGSHDKWNKAQKPPQRLELAIEGQWVIVDHYCMFTWPKSHYNSCLLFGHSHNDRIYAGKQLNVGVMNNNYYPFSWQQIVDIMETRKDNPNLVRKRKPS